MTAFDLPRSLTFVAVLGLTSVVAMAARQLHRTDTLPTPTDRAMAGRRFGTIATWFLSGGTIRTPGRPGRQRRVAPCPDTGPGR